MQIPDVSFKNVSGRIGDKFTVEIQDMYSYSSWFIILLVVVLLIIPVIWLIFFLKNKRKDNKIVSDFEPVKSINLEEIKRKYTDMISEIINKYKSEKLSDRHAYQQLSKVIRHFVYDVTGIRVQNYTLSEIKQVNIPMLYYLIDECYEPEFSKQSNGNIIESCEKASQVISGWN